MNMDVFYLIGVKQIIEHYTGDIIPNGGRIAYLSRDGFPGIDEFFSSIGYLDAHVCRFQTIDSALAYWNDNRERILRNITKNHSFGKPEGIESMFELYDFSTIFIVKIEPILSKILWGQLE